ncbi:MAG: DUF1638 domain-containing protein [Rhizobiales bacterium]|nr:DUF1638 domain-containing protein [Hyphomicrobiales bacterium]
MSARRTLVVACGALAREARAAIGAARLDHVDLTCLPAQLHNRPERIAGALLAKVAPRRAAYDDVLVLYGECGAGPALDRALETLGATRIAGAHCYEFFAGAETFSALSEEEPGTFYVTDFLARHFERLVVRGLGLDRHPDLRDAYFGNYRRLVHLAQADDPRTDELARAAAARLGLAFERRVTGLGALAQFLAQSRVAEPT